jgi:hypothetical protein
MNRAGKRHSSSELRQASDSVFCDRALFMGLEVHFVTHAHLLSLTMQIRGMSLYLRWTHSRDCREEVVQLMFPLFGARNQAELRGSRAEAGRDVTLRRSNKLAKVNNGTIFKENPS